MLSGLSKILGSCAGPFFKENVFFRRRWWNEELFLKKGV